MLPKSRVSSFRKRHHTRKEFENRERRKDANEKKTNKLIHVPLTLHRPYPLPLQPEGLRVLRVRASPPQHHPLQEGQGDDQGGVLDGVFVCAVPERPGVELRPYVRWVYGRYWYAFFFVDIITESFFFFVFVISIIYVFFIIVYIQRLLYDLKN